MISWSPGIRDTAIAGLGALACREAWRNSEHGETMIALVRTAMTDANPVVRMNAAQVFHATHAGESSAARIRLIGDLLADEPNRIVRNMYLRLLGPEIRHSPSEVDSILRQASDQTDDPDTVKGNEDVRDVHIDLLTSLAVHHETPFATEVTHRWAAGAPEERDALRATAFIRESLRPGSDLDAQARAFNLIAVTAGSCIEFWTENAYAGSSAGEASESQHSNLKHTLAVIDSVATQIYFASGAYDEKQSGDSAQTSPSLLERFAELAIPVLECCARSKVPAVVHHVVETLVHIAPTDERRALTSMATAIATDGGYAYDPLSSDVVMPYLRRLLAEQRQLVLYEDAGVNAFRALLSAFASAGNESALELAFNFSDVFR